MRFLLPGRQRAAGRREDLQRPDQALAVARAQSLGGIGIVLRQPGMEGRRLHGIGLEAYRLSDRIGYRRHFGEALFERLEVKARTADHDRQATFLPNAVQRRCGVLAPAPDRIVGGAVDMAIEQMGGPRRFAGVRAGAEHMEVAIDLHGIGVDDAAAESFGKGEGKSRLAACGRTCQKHGIIVSGSHTMSLVATLISHPDRPAIDTEAVSRAAEALGTPQQAVILAPGIAVDIACSADTGPQAIEARLREALAGIPVDLVVQEAEGRRKHLFLADMDSTMIGQECIDELADFVGAKALVAEITERAMRGEIAFEPALRERVALLRGLPESVVDEVIRERLTLTPGGPLLVRTMRANGAYTALVSGGFTLFTARIGAMIGFDEHHSNKLVVKDGVLTGEVAEPILGREAKRANLERLRQERGLAISDTMAVGDGANDLAMLGEAGLGVAYRAKPAVAAAARMRVEHGDLTALLYAQGYAADQIERV